MKMPVLVLLAAHIAISFPLKVGTELGYEVEGFGGRSFLRLNVLGNSGSTWKIALRDSNLGDEVVRLDTAELRDDGNDTVWSKPSCLFPVEPASRKAGWRWTEYGKLGVSCLDQDPAPPNISNVSIDDEKLTYIQISRYVHNLPRARFASDTGIVRYSDGVLGWRCRLAAFNGARLSTTSPWDSLVVLGVPMKPGYSWGWSLRSRWENYTGIASVTGITWGTIRWTVLEALPDSSGWIRRRIRSEEVLSEKIKNAMLKDTTFVVGSLKTSEFVYQVNPLTGSAETGSSWHGMELGFLRYWWEGEIPPGQATWRVSHNGTGSYVSEDRMRTRGGIGPDTVYNTSTDGVREVSIRLESVDSAGSASNARGERRSSSAIGLQEILRILREDPFAVVLVADASGCQRRLSGERAISYLRTHRTWSFLRIEGRSNR